MATFGIDLGTTYSCIAYVDENDRASLIPNSLDEFTTPSVVYYESPGQVLVGRDAKGYAKLNPDLVVSLIKRSMGRDLVLPMHGEDQTPEMISALILRELARYATERTGLAVEDVVITVPAYFGEAEKKATRDAGRIAGLNVLNLVPEPVAAALHYEALGSGQDRTILVFDLGGGTFDTTVIRLAGDAVTVVCTDGDHDLGGADWDRKIADLLLLEFMREHPDSKADESEEFVQEVTNAAEDMKKSLSSARSRRYPMRFGGHTSDFTLSREELENLGSELLERTMEITERTVATARTKGIELFDDVLLVGGATRAPVVAEELNRRFGFEPRLHDPDQAVAKGAARFALIEAVKVILLEDAATPVDDDEAAPGREAPAEQELIRLAADHGVDLHRLRRLGEKTVTTVVPRAFGVKVLAPSSPDQVRVEEQPRDWLVAHVLAANDPVPAHPGTQTFYTAHAGQTEIEIEIWEQAGAISSPDLGDNAKIGDGLISGLPPLPKGSPIDVDFTMDERGLLTVTAQELSTGEQLAIELQIQGLTEEQVEHSRTVVSGYVVSGG
jgi:molecular chaperone DnaK